MNCVKREKTTPKAHIFKKNFFHCSENDSHTKAIKLIYNRKNMKKFIIASSQFLYPITSNDSLSSWKTRRILIGEACIMCNTWANQLCQGLGFYKDMAAHTMATGLEGAREGLWCPRDSAEQIILPTSFTWYASAEFQTREMEGNHENKEKFAKVWKTEQLLLGGPGRAAREKPTAPKPSTESRG